MWYSESGLSAFYKPGATFTRGMKHDKWGKLTDIWPVAFTATLYEYNKIVSTLKTRTEMVLETLVFSSLNHLTRLVAREYFIIRFTEISWQLINDGWTTGRSGFDPRQGQRNFPLMSVSRPALRPTKPPVQWYRGPFPGAKRGRDVTLTSHPHLVPRSRMRRSYSSSPPKRHHGV
jgi:hypothetical protein